MTTATAIINGNTIEADVETIAKILSVVSDTISQVTDTQSEQSDEVEYINWDTFVKNESSKLLSEFYADRSDHVADELVKGLKICRRNEDYRFLIPSYWQLNARENLKVRQFLKLVSACDRIVHFTNTRTYTNQQLSTLRSEIKYARMCPECGSIANKFWDRVMKDPNVTV
jgi:hypothetical protein